MIQVDMVGFYFMGAGLSHLSQLKSTAGLNAKLDILATAEYWLGHFLTPRSVLQCEQARALAEHLLTQVRDATIAIDVGTGEIINESAERIETLLARFGEALAHDIKNLLIFYVPQEGIYSVTDLIAKADEALSAASRAKLSKEAIQDFREGGKCLAFQFNTAAGFHLLRAVEKVLRIYFKLVTGRDADRSHLDWGRCIEGLRKAQNADQKVIGVLDQIRSLHRNPLMHPEVFLNLDEARSVFQISASAIDAMAQHLP